MKIALTIILFVVIISLTSCDNFENKFYYNVDSGQLRRIEKPFIFDLSTITDFQWDSVLYVAGNESVPVFADEIEEDLKRKTTDLPTYRDRFYFLQSNKNLIIKQIKSGIFSHKPAFHVPRCRDSSLNCRSWLSREECIFFLVHNSDNLKDGTVTLVPNCNTTEKSIQRKLCAN